MDESIWKKSVPKHADVAPSECHDAAFVFSFPTIQFWSLHEAGMPSLTYVLYCQKCLKHLHRKSTCNKLKVVNVNYVWTHSIVD